MGFRQPAGFSPFPAGFAQDGWSARDCADRLEIPVPGAPGTRCVPRQDGGPDERDPLARWGNAVQRPRRNRRFRSLVGGSQCRERQSRPEGQGGRAGILPPSFCGTTTTLSCAWFRRTWG
jgi:hypothetical protein